MPLSNADKQRHYRERKAERERVARGLPPREEADEPPEGAYVTTNGFLRPLEGHYVALDGSFMEVPQSVYDERMTNGLPCPETWCKQRAVEIERASQ